MTAVLTFSSLILFILLHQYNQPAAYFLMPTRLWELGSGCLLFLGLSHAKWQIRFLGNIFPLLVTAAIMGVLFVPSKFAVSATIAIVLLTVILIACLRPGTAVYGFFTCRDVLYVGLISYSLYLWHWGVLSISRWTIGVHWWSVPLQVALILLLSMLSYRYVEVPLRQADWSFLRSRSIVFGLWALVVGSVTVSAIEHFSKIINLDALYPSDLYVNLMNAKLWFAKPTPDTGCHLSYSISKPQMEKCLIVQNSANSSGAERILLLGDSHANHYVESLRDAMPEYTVRSFTIGWGCGYLEDTDIDDHNLNRQINCSLYNLLVNEFIDSSIRPGDIVILGHRWSEKKLYSGRKESLQRLARRLSSKGGYLVLIDDVAELNVDNPLLCEKRWWRPFPPRTCYKSLDSVLKDQSSQDEIHQEISKNYKNTYSISLRNLYCSRNACGPYLDNVAVYTDGSHLSKEASSLGSAKLKDLLIRILLESKDELVTEG